MKLPAVPASLHTLKLHSIFLPPLGQDGKPDDDWEVVDPPDELVGQKTSRLAMRDKDLLLAVGRDIRMTALGSGDPWEVLKSPHLSFTVHQLVLSPSGRLLAVVGRSQLVVLILPKSGVIGSTGGEISCRSLAVDEFVFSASADAVISKVSWHPWGDGETSLWVLTSDGQLREYDIHRPQDSIQTFSFLPPNSAASSSRYTAVDPLSRFATSFAFSAGAIGFGPLMVYVLVANGDLYLMGPVMPLRCDMPLRYLQGLKAYADSRLQSSQSSPSSIPDANSSVKLGRARLQAQWVHSLVKQVKQQEESRLARETDDLATPSRQSSNLRGHRRIGSSATTDSRDIQQASEGFVRVHPPHLSESGGPAPGGHRAVIRQGPVVFSPGPSDMGDDEDEDVASDLLLLEHTTSDGGSGQASASQVVIAMAWSSNRIDLGVEVERPEPRWISSAEISAVPIEIAIVESIQLDHREVEQLGPKQAPILAVDSVHRDVLYIQHSFGVDSVGLATLLQDGDSGCEVIRLVDSAASDPVTIVGMLSFSNISFGYGLLALGSTRQLAAVELEFRIGQDPLEGKSLPEVTKTPVSSVSTNGSLLLAKAFDVEPLLSSVRQPVNVRAIARKVPESTKPIQTVSPDLLRALGEITSQIQSRVEAIRTASLVVENRIDLEVQELQRQLKLVRDCQERIAELKKLDTLQRASKLIATQSALEDRLDHVLGELTAEYRPQIGDVEQRWFDELERLKVRVQGGGVLRGKGFAGRAQVLKEQLVAVKPTIETDSTSLTDEIPTSPSNYGNYGHKQLKPLEAALSTRSDEIYRLMKRVEGLSMKVESAEEDADDED